MSLNGRQKKLLREALLSAFSYQGLRELMMFDLNVQLDAVVGEGALTEVVFDLIQWADQTGRVDELVRAALQNRPNNPLVQGVASELLTPAAPPAAGTATYGGLHRSRLRAALLEYFPRHSDLAMLLDDTVSANLDAVVGNTNLTEATFELTKWLGMDLKGRLKPFLVGAIKQRPNAAELRALYIELFG